MLNISTLMDTASAKSWEFVVLLFVSSFAIAIIILALFKRRFKKRKEIMASGIQQELLMTRLNELIDRTKDKDTKTADI